MNSPVAASDAEPILRRSVLKGAVALGAAAAGALTAERGAAAPAPAAPESGATLKAAGATGERLPVVGLGTFITFDLVPGADRTKLFEVAKRYWEAGARVVDTSPLYGSGEITAGDALMALGANQACFVANKIWSTGEHLGDESHALRSLEQSLGRLWRDRIDLMQCHSLVNVDVVVPILKAWKKEGRIRFVGLTHHENGYHPLLAGWLDRGGVDFVQVNYSIANRSAEDTVLKAAARNGVAVMVNMPFEKARLFKLVEGRDLPDFARDAGMASWAEFFLKWSASHPAVACVLPATSDPEHASENVKALRGPLPDPDLRERMARHVAALQGYSELGKTPWYPGKRYAGLIARSQAAVRARI